MSLIEVEKAMFAAVVAALPDVAFEYPNSPFAKPTDGSKYGLLHFVHGSADAFSLGSEGTDEHTGFVQLDMSYPLDIGWQDAASDFDELTASCTRGTTYQSGGQVVRAQKCLRSVGKREDDRYRVTFTIYWWTEIER